MKTTIEDSTNETTDLEKLKYPQTKIVPRMEKAIMELESTLQRLSVACDDR